MSSLIKGQKEEPSATTLRMIEQLPGDGRYTRVVPLPPCFDPLANGIDRLQLKKPSTSKTLLMQSASLDIVYRTPSILQHWMSLFVSPPTGSSSNSEFDDGIVNDKRHGLKLIS